MFSKTVFLNEIKQEKPVTHKGHGKDGLDTNIEFVRPKKEQDVALAKYKNDLSKDHLRRLQMEDRIKLM